MIQSCIILTLIVTVYLPGAGGINGGTRGGYDFQKGGVGWVGGKTIQIGDAACGFSYPFGTTFTILDHAPELKKLGIGETFTCWDRGGAVKDANLDLALPIFEPFARTRAADWGRRLANVRVCGKSLLANAHHPRIPRIPQAQTHKDQDGDNGIYVRPPPSMSMR